MPPETTVPTGTGSTATAPTPVGGGAIPGPPAEGGTRGGKIVVGFLNEGNSNDPAIGYTETSWDSICNLTFSPLYTYAADGVTPKANAAAALPEVSDDGLTYSIPLREGVAFHNGRPVTAADYKYAWERVLDPKIESWAASYIYSIKGAKELFRKKAKSLAGVRVVDDMTLEVTLAQPDVTFLFALTQPFMAPVPKEEVERLGDKFAVTPVGNGPFRIDAWDQQGRTGHFSRFDAYFWPPLPYVDEVEFQWGLNASVQLLKMERGDVDVLYSGFTGNQVARVQASSQLRPFLFQQALFANRWVNLHPRVPAFRDARVREALNWATNREQLGRITGPEASAWGAPYPESMNADARTFQPYGLDVGKARSLLAEAGASDLAFTLWVTSSPEPELGQVLQQQWKAAGVDVTLKQTSVDTVYDLSLKGGCDAWFSTYYAIYPTPLDLISQYYETGGSSNYTHYSNKDVDRLTAQARQTVDAGRRDTLLAQVEQILGDDAVHCFLETVNWLMGVNQERLQNYHYSGVYGAYYDRLWVES